MIPCPARAVYKRFTKYGLRKMRLSTLRIVTAGASRIAQYSVPFAAISVSLADLRAAGWHPAPLGASLRPTGSPLPLGDDPEAS